ncbi:unnamed protein product [Caenorhabditis bovis]|uniref:Uncharacterized protein n=1 Tax=Caenorhabditis bovis TaxID=2654633 RepID=A0A8S1F0H2_9PELO|nr:unnamed protein product [Caenorhabditis bovis]
MMSIFPKTLVKHIGANRNNEKRRRLETAIECAVSIMRTIQFKLIHFNGESVEFKLESSEDVVDKLAAKLAEFDLEFDNSVYWKKPKNGALVPLNDPNHVKRILKKFGDSMIKLYAFGDHLDSSSDDSDGDDDDDVEEIVVKSCKNKREHGKGHRGFGRKHCDKFGGPHKFWKHFAHRRHHGFPGPHHFGGPWEFPGHPHHGPRGFERSCRFRGPWNFSDFEGPRGFPGHHGPWEFPGHRHGPRGFGGPCGKGFRGIRGSFEC